MEAPRFCSKKKRLSHTLERLDIVKKEPESVKKSVWRPFLGCFFLPGWAFCSPGVYKRQAGEAVTEEKQAAVTATVVIDAGPWAGAILERSALTEPVKKR